MARSVCVIIARCQWECYGRVEAANNAGTFHTDFAAVYCYYRRQYNHYSILYHCRLCHSARVCLSTAGHAIIIQVGIVYC